MVRDEEAGRLVNDEELKAKALEAVEQHGIVFIDEIDKVAKRGNVGGADVSREGVQRDLLHVQRGSANGLAAQAPDRWVCSGGKHPMR